MRFAIGVHGRFYAFDLAPALLELGVDVSLFTNYPGTVVERFGFPKQRTTALLTHGLAARVADRMLAGREPRVVEAALKRYFGRWLRDQVAGDAFDAVFCWSGVAEETFRATRARRLLNRSSLHIRAQLDLLAAESRRVGHRLKLPTPWIVAREEREYALADAVIVPTASARRSFAEFAPQVPVELVPLTAATERWRPPPGVVAARIARLQAGDPLRIAFVGNVSYQKGLHDLVNVIDALRSRMRFRITGAIQPECRALLRRLNGKAAIDGHVREAELPDVYAWADIVILPSIQDGFPVVLAHAQASAVPILASENTGAHELLAMGGRGWVIPIRSPDAIIQQLEWCDDHRTNVATMVRELFDYPLRRSWRDVAAEILTHATACKGGA